MRANAAATKDGAELIDLRLGDYLGPNGIHLLEGQSVDHVIVDPPFSPRAHRNCLTRPKGRKQPVARDLDFDPIDDESIRVLAGQFSRICKRWCLVFVGEDQVGTWIDELTDAGMRFVRLGVAVRRNPVPRFDGRAPSLAVDPIVIAHSQAPMRWHGGGKAARWDAPVVRYEKPFGQIHATQKPLTLMKALVSDFTDEGDLVCDPFAGSGTTAVACHELGRNFVGWEIQAVHHANALRRLNPEQQELDLASAQAGGRLSGVISSRHIDCSEEAAPTSDTMGRAGA